MVEPLVAHVSKAKTLRLILIAAAFLAAGVWFVTHAPDIAASSRRALLQDPTAVRWFGWATIVFSLACGAAVVRQLFVSGPVLEIDGRGILWRRWSDQVIPWSAIVRAEPLSIHNQKFLSLWLDAPENYPPRSALRRLPGMNKGMGFGDITLNLQATDQSFDRLLEVVSAHLHRR